MDPELQAEVVLRRKVEYCRAIRNLVGHHKRSMLDFIDLRLQQLDPGDRHTRDALEILKRRVHSEMSLFGDQVLGVFEIFVNEGVIPAFGRPDPQTRIAPAEVTARIGNGNGHGHGKDSACPRP